MAKAPPPAPVERDNSLNSIFYTIMSIMALNFLGGATFVAVSTLLGFCTTDDLFNMAQVLIGNNKYVMSNQQIAEYEKLLADRAAEEKRLDETLGSRATREAAAAATMDLQRELEERIRVLQILRTQQENQLVEIRQQIEATKRDAQREYEKLQAARKNATVVELSQNSEKMKKTLLAMEPEQISVYFAQILPSAGPSEIARMIHAYLTPEITAEVLAALPALAVRKILPVVENRYADVDAAAVVRAWTTPGTDDYKNIEQMAEYLKRMSIPQAFGVFNQLDPKTRSSLVQLLQAP
ncbi:hypothetical protein AGMMS49959_02590 [Planctomycetales bacterium]|nr:hypothetical protein AGMMS49959_02590 [Planctomycetales bacterium]